MATALHRVIVVEFVSLDGVTQDPDGVPVGC